LLIFDGLAGVYISGFRATQKERDEFIALGNGCCNRQSKGHGNIGGL
jgi:hypothetical protein